MLRLIKSLCFIACLSPAAALSERHVASEMPTAMTQVNLCYLNEGKTMEDVDTFNKTFFDWTRAEGIQPHSLILTPVANAAEALDPTYDFVELLIAPYQTIGGMWDKVATSEEGQAQLTGWAEIATCATRFTHLVHKYTDQAATAATDNRVVEFNRCRVHESAEGLMKDKHARMLASRPESATNIYWGVMLPAAGGERSVFRHLIGYPDMVSYTAALQRRSSKESMTAQQEYSRMYAKCDGPSVWAGRVQSRPATES